MLLSLPSYFKTRSKLVVLASGITSGLFFGLLVTVSSIIGKLDDGTNSPQRESFYITTKSPSGQQTVIPRPYWMISSYLSEQQSFEAKDK